VSSAWASKLTRWWDHSHNGVPHSLGHVHPFRFGIELLATDKYPAKTVEIRVGFSCHTFTRELDGGDTGVQPYLTRGSEMRMFCPDRYALSKLLPDIVRTLPTRKCYFAKQQNYFVVELPQQLPQGEEYRVFFDVRHIGEADAVLLYVQSAYSARQGIGGPRGIRAKKVGFRVLVNLALRNQRPMPAP
jgi:hypothetical protein